MELKEALPVGTKVKFGDEWLSRMDAGTQKRYSGRVGFIHGYRMQNLAVPWPIVDFPKHGRLKSERLFEVMWSRLELADQR